MDVLHGEGNYRIARIPDEPDVVVQALLAGHPVLIEVTEYDPEQFNQIRAGMQPLMGLTSPPRVVAVLVSDGVPDTVSDDRFTLVVDHTHLVATPDEVELIRPEVYGDPVLLMHALHYTGGVPALLEVPGVDKAAYATDVARAASDWAERAYPRVAGDDLLRLLVWVGRAAPDSFRVWASEVLDVRVSGLAVERLASLCCIHHTGVPVRRAPPRVGDRPAGAPAHP